MTCHDMSHQLLGRVRDPCIIFFVMPYSFLNPMPYSSLFFSFSNPVATATSANFPSHARPPSALRARTVADVAH